MRQQQPRPYAEEGIAVVPERKRETTPLVNQSGESEQGRFWLNESSRRIRLTQRTDCTPFDNQCQRAFCGFKSQTANDYLWITDLHFCIRQPLESTGQTRSMTSSSVLRMVILTGAKSTRDPRPSKSGC